jgi:NADPH2:quinone reductase
MYAVRLHAFGPAENLRYEQVDDPIPGRGEVLIEVRAAGVHLADTVLRSGRQVGPMPLPDLPSIPGREVAGVVQALGPDVDGSWLDRRVAAHLGPLGTGGYAQFVCCPVEVLHPVPDGLTEEAAVAMIGTGRTALGILASAQLTAGDVLVVTAAAGGVGSLLVQAGRQAGATVVGLAGGPVKVDQVRQLGAEIAVDYDRPGWPELVRDQLAGRAVTVALDGVGGAAGRAVLELLDPGGRLVLFGWSSGQPTPLSTMDIIGRGLTVSSVLGRLGGLYALASRALAEAAAGRLVPLVGQRFPLAEAAQAHTAVAGRGTVGKTVLVPAAGSGGRG